MARPNWEYIRVDVLLPEHPKLDGLSDGAKWLLITLWCHCGQHLTDGFVRDRKWRRTGTPRQRQQLIDAGLADPAEGGYMMRNFVGEDGHQRSRAEVMDLKEKRRSSGRKGGQAKAKAVASAKASAGRRTRRRGSGKGSATPRPAQNGTRAGQLSTAPFKGAPQGKSPAQPQDASWQVLQQTPSKNVAEAEAEAEADKSMADVVTQSNGRRGPAQPDLTDLIINELRQTTGKEVSRDWAAKTLAYILDGRRVTDPAAYVRQVIRSEPDPRSRFLPLY